MQGVGDGSADGAGIIPRMNKDLFDRCASLKGSIVSLHRGHGLTQSYYHCSCRYTKKEEISYPPCISCGVSNMRRYYQTARTPRGTVLSVAPILSTRGSKSQLRAVHSSRIAMQRDADANKMFLVTCSYFEIYNEVIRCGPPVITVPRPAQQYMHFY